MPCSCSAVSYCPLALTAPFARSCVKTGGDAMAFYDAEILKRQLEMKKKYGTYDRYIDKLGAKMWEQVYAEVKNAWPSDGHFSRDQIRIVSVADLERLNQLPSVASFGALFLMKLSRTLT